MAITKAWKVYGKEGHDQHESFDSSFTYDFSTATNIRIIAVENSDITHTNEYAIIKITRPSAEECKKELRGQLSDGIFENYKVGKVVEIK